MTVRDDAPAGRRRRRRIGGRVPAALLLPAVLGLAFLVLPLVGLLLRTPWGTWRAGWPNRGC
ncbi:hypothetical protein GCM10027605_67420 [Micromonospora zhanjiangensis]